MPAIMDFSIKQIAGIGFTDSVGITQTGINVEKFEEVIEYSQNFWM